MAKRKANGSIKVYRTYRFRDKDPIIDKMRTALQDEANLSGVSERQMERVACNLSGLSNSTTAGWFRKDTKRPQFATLNAFARAIDHELALVRHRKK